MIYATLNTAKCLLITHISTYIDSGRCKTCFVIRPNRCNKCCNILRIGLFHCLFQCGSSLLQNAAPTEWCGDTNYKRAFWSMMLSPCTLMITFRGRNNSTFRPQLVSIYQQVEVEIIPILLWWGKQMVRFFLWNSQYFMSISNGSNKFNVWGSSSYQERQRDVYNVIIWGLSHILTLYECPGPDFRRTTPCKGEEMREVLWWCGRQSKQVLRAYFVRHVFTQHTEMFTKKSRPIWLNRICHAVFV